MRYLLMLGLYWMAVYINGELVLIPVVTPW